MSRRSGDAGVMTLVLTLFVTLLAVGTADAAAFIQARVKASIAADAAALAAADATTWLNDASPSAEANRLAQANGATLVSCTCGERQRLVRVTVETRTRAMLLAGWQGRAVRATSAAAAHRWVDSWRPL